MSNSHLAQLTGLLYRLPIFIPFVVVGQMMRTFLAPHGLLNIFLAQLALIDLNSPLQFFNLQGLVLSFVWKQVPFMTLIILGGFQMIEFTDTFFIGLPFITTLPMGHPCSHPYG